MKEEQIKIAVSDAMSDFYNEVPKKRMDNVDLRLFDLMVVREALVKIVDYSRLEAKVREIEGRLKKLESK